MFGTILDVGIGLILVYLLLSLIISVINEWLNALVDRRPRNLKDGLKMLLGPMNITADDFLQLPLIKTLSTAGSTPSYLPSPQFANAILDKVFELGQAAQRDLATLKAIAAAQPALKPVILPLIDTAADLTQAKEAIEKWFNDGMDRVTGVYKRYNMVILVVLSGILIGLTNADTLSICKTLWANPALRESAIAAAKVQAEKAASQAPTAEFPARQIRQTQDQLNNLSVLTAWHAEREAYRLMPASDKPGELTWWTYKILGLICTIAAVSLGAPFWFDTLNKVIRFRSAVKPNPDKKG